MRYTVEIFPHRNFFNVLELVNLTCKVYFSNDCSSDELEVPQTAKDHVTFDFHGPDYGEPDRIIIRQNQPLKKRYQKDMSWLLDSITSEYFGTYISSTDSHGRPPPLVCCVEGFLIYSSISKISR